MSKRSILVFNLIVIAGSIAVMGYTSWMYCSAFTLYRSAISSIGSTFFYVGAFLITGLQLFIILGGCYCIKESVACIRRNLK